MIYKTPFSYVLFSQLSLLAAIVLCVMIQPSVVFTRNQGGLSNYGTEMPTLFIFSLGVWLCVGFLILARNRISNTGIRLALAVLAVSYMLVAISTYPYKINSLFENIHIVIGFAFALMQLVLTVWFARINKYDQITKLSLLIMAASLAVGIMTLLQYINQLFSSQIVSGVSFGILLVHSINKSSVRKV